jgi:hypothetical protein
VSYLQADLILNKEDKGALADATQAAMAQCAIPRDNPTGARSAALDAARQSLMRHDTDVRQTLNAFQTMVRSMAIRPGERSLILVSPGFFFSASAPEIDAVEERAVRSGIIISALDAQGLYTRTGFDADQQYADNYAREQQRQQSNVLVALADATGGKVFENSNDYDAGFQSLEKRPETVYLLGFSPTEQKPDGRYHRLKVKLSTGKGLEVQARRGYVAANHTTDPVQEAQEEIRNALFSRDETKEIPVAVKLTLGREAAVPHVIVFTHVDLTQVALQEGDGHFRDKLTLAFGFFDGNGRLVVDQEQEFSLDIPRDDLATRLKSGVDLRSDLKAGAGQFLRIILRDVNGRMSTLNEVLAQ